MNSILNFQLIHLEVTCLVLLLSISKTDIIIYELITGSNALQEYHNYCWSLDRDPVLAQIIRVGHFWLIWRNKRMQW